MSWKERARAIGSRIRNGAEQLYTPRELRAIVLFIFVGLAVVLVRGGKKMYYSYFPEQRDTTYRSTLKQQDSLFFTLSAAANRKDSLFFSLPEDSLLPASQKKKLEHHTKEESLRPGIIALNSATKEDLMRLPGVGSATAERILDYRSERGRFRKLDELSNIKGFGKKKFEKIRTYLRLN